jgi:glutaredoxin-related protein
MASALDRIKSDIDANEIVLFMKGTLRNGCPYP